MQQPPGGSGGCFFGAFRAARTRNFPVTSYRLPEEITEKFSRGSRRNFPALALGSDAAHAENFPGKETEEKTLSCFQPEGADSPRQSTPARQTLRTGTRIPPQKDKARKGVFDAIRRHVSEALPESARQSEPINRNRRKPINRTRKN